MSALLGRRSALVFYGDGIGREIVTAAQRVLDAALAAHARAPLRYDERFCEARGLGLAGLGEPELAAFDEHRLVLKGPLTIEPGSAAQSITLADGRRFSSANQVLRKTRQLFANVRPVRSYAGVRNTVGAFDWVVFRENTEDVYTGEERVLHAGTPDELVEGVKRNSVRAARRIGVRAAAYAVENGRRRITVLHKANVCKLGDGMWLREATDAARATLAELGAADAVKVDDQLADSFLCDAVRTPARYDILLCPNLIGDFVSDMAGGLAGSLGLCGSANLGEQHGLFEPAHGSAPDIAGKGVANPISMILSGSLMLRAIGEADIAAKIERAIERTTKAGETTRELGGSLGTAEVTEKIVAYVEADQD